MKTRLVLILVLVLASLLVTTVHAEYRYTNDQFLLQSIRVVSTTPLKVGPVAIEVVLLHKESTVLEDVRIDLAVDKGRTLSPSLYLKYVYPGQLVRARFVVETSVNTLHRVTVSITWSKAYEAVSLQKGTEIYYTPGSVLRDVPDTQELSAKIFIPGMPQLVAYTSPSIIVPNVPQVVRVYLCNNGSASAYNVIARLDIGLEGIPAGAAVSVLNLSGAVLRASVLEPDKCAVLELTLVAQSPSPAIAISVPLVLTLSYVDDVGVQHRERQILHVSAASSGLVKIYPLRSTLPPGSVANLTLRVCNLYALPLRNVSLTLTSSTNVIVLSNSSLRIGVLQPHRCVDVIVRVATPRVVRVERCALSYLVSYELSPGLYTSYTTQVELSLLPAPELVIADVSIAPPRVPVGGLVTISFRVLNLGSSDAYSVNITLIPDEHAKLVTTPYAFYGKLGVQEETVAAFTLNATKPGIAHCKVVVHYMDEFGNKYKTERVVSFLVANQTPVIREELYERLRQVQMTALIVGVVIAVVVVALALVIVLRRRRS